MATQLYDRIRSICEMRGISVAAVERKANLANGTIGRWNESSPRVNNLKQVAEILECDLESLIEESTN